MKQQKLIRQIIDDLKGPTAMLSIVIGTILILVSSEAKQWAPLVVFVGISFMIAGIAIIKNNWK